MNLDFLGNTPSRSPGMLRDHVVTRQYKDSPYHETEIVSAYIIHFHIVIGYRLTWVFSARKRKFG